MAKKILMVTLLFIYIVGIIFITIPHHAVTEKQAIDLACEYYIYRMNDTDLQIKDIKVSKAYKNSVNGYIYLTYNESNKYSSNILNTILDFWNPNLVFYSVSIRSNKFDGVSFSINVDSYSGYIQDGSEGIMWKRPPKEAYTESINEVHK